MGDKADRHRLLVIGLDGATFDLIEPWVRSGDLPNLARLMEQGSWGPLRSTTPAMTFPAWSTMMTGMNPGRHGIFDFTRRIPGRYAVEFTNATHRRSPTLWRLLSDAGYRVGVMGLPTTYPPEPVNGFVIAGFDAPVTTGIDASFVFPGELLTEIQRVGAYRFTDFQELHIGPGWHADARVKLEAGLSDRLAIAQHLLDREDWDCFVVLFGESDTVSHHFWMFQDPSSPRYDPHLAARWPYAGAIRSIYRRLDGAIGQLIESAPGATCIILSDHGFGGTGDKVLYLNRWLNAQGFLRFKPGPGLMARAIGLGKRLGLRLLPSTLQEQIFRRGDGWLANRLESSSRFSGIDWPQSRAFSEETNTCPAIWLNVRGREPLGTVAPSDYEAVRTEIIDHLHAWRNPDTAQPIVKQAWRREELYHGPFVEEAPDIILELALDDGYAYTCQSSRGRPGPGLRRLDRSEYVGSKGRSMNGSHRSDGILIMAGPGVRQGQKLIDADLMDVGPTLMALLRAPASVAMDGRVLQEALHEPLPLGGNEPESLRVGAPGPVRSYAPFESAVLRERLQSLGYLE